MAGRQATQLHVCHVDLTAGTADVPGTSGGSRFDYTQANKYMLTHCDVCDMMRLTSATAGNVQWAWSSQLVYQSPGI